MAPARPRLQRHHPRPRPETAGWWAALLALSALASWLLDLTGLPATLLLGPMIAAIVLAVRGVRLAVAPRLVDLAQGVIGALLARSLSVDILRTCWQHLPLFLAVVTATIALSTLLGWMMTRLRLLPGSTAIWGSSPGAASAMMLIAEAFGADPRLVAFMQYMRVVFVAITASLVAEFWPHPQTAAAPAHHAAPATVSSAPGAFAFTVLLIGLAAWLGRRFRLPAGPLLLIMAVGGVLHAGVGIAIVLPRWLLAASYALLGWRIGSSFTPAIVRAALHALAPVIGSIVALIGFGMGMAWLLTSALGVDPLTAYLATSPGGLDSVAIIAASTPVDLSFVTALQTLRFLMVLALTPTISRHLGRRVARDPGCGPGCGG